MPPDLLLAAGQRTGYRLKSRVTHTGPGGIVYLEPVK
jgi:hypothetical protein